MFYNTVKCYVQPDCLWHCLLSSEFGIQAAIVDFSVVLVTLPCRHHRRFGHATLRLRNTIRQHHPPQRALLSQICCLGEDTVVVSQILLNLSHVIRGRPGCLLLQSIRRFGLVVTRWPRST